MDKRKFLFTIINGSKRHDMQKKFQNPAKNPAILIISINSYWATIDTSQKSRQDLS